VVPDQADQGAFKDEEVGIAVRAGAHLGGAEIEAVVGLVHGGFHGPLGSGVSPHVNDGQVFFHGILPLCPVKPSAENLNYFQPSNTHQLN
jgi:hypothetical protein